MSVIKMKSEKELSVLFSKEPDKFRSLCRICLCDFGETAIPLFSDNGDEIKDEKSADNLLDKSVLVFEKIMICCGITIQNNEILPKTICKSCNHDLDIAHEFRNKCQQADMLLKNILSEYCESENNLVKDSKLKSDALKENTEFPEILVSIKEELIDYNSDVCYEDLDEDYVPDVDVKKKKKTSKKSKNKQLKNESLDTGNVLLKIENDIHEESANSLLEDKLSNENLSEKGEKKFSCHLCNKPLATKYSLTSHLEKMHGEEKKQKMGIVTGYGAERRFHCSECDYKCRRRQALHYHMTIHTGIKPFKCDQCPKSFAQHGSLYTHRKTHSDKMYYTCQECGKQFKHRDIFKNHRRVHSSEFKFTCTICNKGLKTQKTLNEHMNRHLQIKNYSCEFCGLAFVTRVELANHLRVHNKTNNTYQCSFCEYSSYSKKTLSVHIKRHTGERSYSCDRCEYSCYTPGELRFHIRKHTKEQNYSCPVCEMKFRHSTSVNKHMLRRHGEKYKWNDVVDRRVVK